MAACDWGVLVHVAIWETKLSGDVKIFVGPVVSSQLMLGWTEGQWTDLYAGMDRRTVDGPVVSSGVTDSLDLAIEFHLISFTSLISLRRF
jgi:hypothetical protein